MNQKYKILISSSLLILSTLSFAADNIKKESESQALKAANMLSNSIKNTVEQQSDYTAIRKSFREKQEIETKDIQAKIDSLPIDVNKQVLFELELQKWNKVLPLKYQEMETVRKKLIAGEFTDPTLLMMILKDTSFNVFSIKAYDHADQYKIPNDLVFKYSEILAITKDKFITGMKKQKKFKDSYNEVVRKGGEDLKKYNLQSAPDQRLIDIMTKEFVISNVRMANPMYVNYVGRIVPEVLVNKKENSANSTKNYNFHQCLALYNIFGTEWDCPHKAEAEQYMETNTNAYKDLFKEHYE